MADSEKEYAVGKEFNARKSLPFTSKGRPRSDESPWIKYGEKIRITAIDLTDELPYTLLNLDLGNEEAWVKVTLEELRLIKHG